MVSGGVATAAAVALVFFFFDLGNGWAGVRVYSGSVVLAMVGVGVVIAVDAIASD